MILDLGQFGGLVEMTATFSNAVVVAMLPHVSDVVTRLELPMPLPITRQQIVRGGPNQLFESRNGQMMGCGFELEGGWVLGFQEGILSHFETPHSFYMLQNPDEIPRFVGKVRMDKEDAVQMARDTLRKLGIPLEAVFAEQEPSVKPPSKTRTGIVPHYLVKWLSPRGGESVEIEVNADAKRVEYLKIVPNSNIRRPWPDFGVKPVFRPKRLAANPEYAWKLLPIVLRAVDDYSKTLALPIPKPLTTNHVARFWVSDNGGWPHSELELTNGWRFVYRNSMVNGYYSPDALFDFDRRSLLIKNLVGKSKLSEAEAIKLIRQSLAKLNYPANLVRVNFKPRVIKPAVAGIPRSWFWWNRPNEAGGDLVSKIEAEVDMEKGELKSLYFDHRAFWGKPPPIDVPISLPMASDTPASKAMPSAKPQPSPKTPAGPPVRSKLPGSP